MADSSHYVVGHPRPAVAPADIDAVQEAVQELFGKFVWSHASDHGATNARRQLIGELLVYLEVRRGG